ncbi:hypothetical protein ABK040_005251 [Willaertia magna]
MKSSRRRLERLLPKGLVDALFDKIVIEDEYGWIKNFIHLLNDEKFIQYQQFIVENDTFLFTNNNISNNNNDEYSQFKLSLFQQYPWTERPLDKNHHQQDVTTVNSNVNNNLQSYYLPKFNTYYKHQNENLHIEKGDEFFELFGSEDNEMANRIGLTEEQQEEHLKTIKQTNIIRSKGMATSLHLRIQEDVKPFIQENLAGKLFKFLKKFPNNHLLSFRTIQTQEQAIDLYRQLFGEDEQIILDDVTVKNEIIRILQELSLLKENDGKKEDNGQKGYFSSYFKKAYLLFLRVLDFEIIKVYNENLNNNFVNLKNKINFDKLKRIEYPKSINNFQLQDIPLSLEYIGYLSTIYYIPWKDYSKEDECLPLIIPWILFNNYNSKINNLTEVINILPKTIQKFIIYKHNNIYKDELNKIKNRIKGILILNENEYFQEISHLKTIELLGSIKSFYKEIQFYENEKKKLNPETDPDIEELQQLLKNYKRKLDNRERLNHFVNQLHKLNIIQ